mgnify:CR=1 FL=1
MKKHLDLVFKVLEWSKYIGDLSMNNCISATNPIIQVTNVVPDVLAMRFLKTLLTLGKTLEMWFKQRIFYMRFLRNIGML